MAQSTSGLEYYEKLLTDFQYDKAIVEISHRIQEDSENLEYRSLIFRAYLGKRSFKNAIDTLNFIKERRNNYQTDYLEAILLLQTKRFKEAEILLLKIKNQIRRYTPVYLSLFELELEKKNSEMALRYLDSYRKIAGTDESWYIYQGRWLLNKLNNSNKDEKILIEEQLKNFLSSYASAYPKSHHYYFLLNKSHQREFYRSRNPFHLAEAIKSIDMAIELESYNFLYLDEKVYLLYLEKKYGELKKLISQYQLSGSKNRQNNQEFTESELRFLYLEMMLDFEQLKQPDRWFVLSQPEHAGVILSKLAKLNKHRPDNIIYQYFIEELFIANPKLVELEPVISNIKNLMVNIRLKNAQNSLKQGHYSLMEENILRGLQLEPDFKPLHDIHLEFLRIKQREEDALKKLDLLISYTNEDVAKNKIKKSIVEKRLRTSIRNRYQLPPLDSEVGVNESWNEKSKLVRVGLVVTDVAESTQFRYPYYQIVFSHMLARYLNQTSFVEIKMVREGELESQRNDYDYYIYTDLSREIESSSVDYRLVENARLIEVTNISQIAEGNRQLTHLINGSEKMLDVIPKIASIVRIDDHLIVIDIGKRAGIMKEDGFLLPGSEKVFDIRQLDDYYTELTVNDFNVLNQIKLGNVVRLAPRKTTPDSESE